MEPRPVDASAPATSPSQFRDDVLSGLSRPQKSLPSKYFYDERGSALFDAICELDEYYLTRAELEIMERFAGEMAALIGSGARLVEFGSGNSLKTEILLDHLEAPVAYVPIDISISYLESSTTRLRQRYPGLLIKPVAADYTNRVTLPVTPSPSRTVVYFPGSTIGNFVPEEAADFLCRIATLTGERGGLLIGVDLQKDKETLEAAYNDASGVTAAFNLNLLHRIRRELSANVDPNAFRHEARYDSDHGRIEMHLVSETAQSISVDGQEFSFNEGESILTEYSYKYSTEAFAELAAIAGFQQERIWIDSRSQFSVQYLQLS